jgi:two-component system cell cycle response regulator DivK
MTSYQLQILVVDDDYDSLQVTMQAVRIGGGPIEVIGVHDGEECMDRLKTIHPSLIVMDLALPQMDGWQTLASIRAIPALARIPVVAITAYHSYNVAEDARRAGFDAYFPKPLNVSTFMNNLEQIIVSRS